MSQTIVASGNGSSAQSDHPARPVAIVGNGRVGGAFARSLLASSRQVLGPLGRADHLTPLAGASIIVVAVPDDALGRADRAIAGHVSRGALVVHTSGRHGPEALAACEDAGARVAALHPALPIASAGTPLAGGAFAITCAPGVVAECKELVRELGGTPVVIDADRRAVYHAALVMASNFAVALAGDAADLLGEGEILIPLLRRTVENIAEHGPDAALTGPVVRGDAGTVRAHLSVLPEHLREMYVANARRVLDRAVTSGRLDPERARDVAEALEQAAVR